MTSMAESIVKQINYSALIEQWKQAESEGVQFPVPLHDYWAIAGHKSKRNAFESVEGVLQEGIVFLRNTAKKPGRGRSRLLMHLTLPGLEHLCLAARTPQGYAVRELYRQAKAKWDKVKEIAPDVAHEVEILQLKAEIAKQEAIGKQAEQKTLELRHYVTTALPEPIQQKILGYKTIEKVEYRDRQFMDGDLINDGSTMTQAEAMDRLGIKRSELKKLYDLLPEDAFESQPNIVCNRQLRRDYFAQLQELFIGKAQRQRYLGE